MFAPHTPLTHTSLLSPLPPLPLRPPSSPAPAQALTQSEFTQATWNVVNSPSTSVTKWGPIKDWDTSGVPSFENAFATGRNAAGDWTGYVSSNPKAATFNGDVSKWNTSSAKSLDSTFYGAAAFNGNVSAWNTSSVKSLTNTFTGTARSTFTGTGLDLWNINKVKDMTQIFLNAKALTSCNKRKIADAWKSNAAFTATTYDTDWAAECPQPCEAGTSFSTSGNTPCNACAAAATCTAGVKTACTTTTNTVCKVSAVSLLFGVCLIKHHFR